MENKKLYRSMTSSYLGGVCGGIAEYFNIDPALVRILFILVAIYGGAGVLFYLILWIVIPRRPLETYDYYKKKADTVNQTEEFQNVEDQVNQSQTMNDFDQKPASINKKGNGSVIAGIILVTLGTLFLADNFIPNIDFSDIWPVILVVAGIGLISSNFIKKNPNNEL
jgi:phage shock protein PspC (stress-responsive transcriptional regulator)